MADPLELAKVWVIPIVYAGVLFYTARRFPGDLVGLLIGSQVITGVGILLILIRLGEIYQSLQAIRGLLQQMIAR